MANVLRDFLGYLRLGEEDDYEEYLEEFEEEENARLERFERSTKADRKDQPYKTERKAGKSFAELRAEEEASSSELKKERAAKTDRTTNNKVVPIRKNSFGMEVCIMKPTSFEDSQDICDMLLNGRATVVNLEGFDPADAQRIMDFISGAVYAINGKLHQISKYIFIFSPDSIDISGDYLDLVPEEGFGVPTLNKDF